MGTSTPISLMHGKAFDPLTARVIEFHRCCICFEAFAPEALYEDLDGQRWDVCWECVPMAFGTIAILTIPVHDAALAGDQQVR